MLQTNNNLIHVYIHSELTCDSSNEGCCNHLQPLEMFWQACCGTERRVRENQWMNTVSQPLSACENFCARFARTSSLWIFLPRIIRCRMGVITRLVWRRPSCEHKSSWTTLSEVNREIKTLRINVGVQYLKKEYSLPTKHAEYGFLEQSKYWMFIKYTCTCIYISSIENTFIKRRYRENTWK